MFDSSKLSICTSLEDTVDGSRHLKICREEWDIFTLDKPENGVVGYALRRCFYKDSTANETDSTERTERFDVFGHVFIDRSHCLFAATNRVDTSNFCAEFDALGLPRLSPNVKFFSDKFSINIRIPEKMSNPEVQKGVVEYQVNELIQMNCPTQILNYFKEWAKENHMGDLDFEINSDYMDGYGFTNKTTQMIYQAWRGGNSVGINDTQRFFKIKLETEFYHSIPF